MAKTAWCDTCYKVFMADAKMRIGDDKNVFFDTTQMSFRCKVPTFTHDLYGNPVVIIHNCETKRDLVLSQADWLQKRNTGEL